MSKFFPQKINDNFVLSNEFITQMVANDQFNYDHLISAPRGVLALNEYTSDLNIVTSTLTKSVNLSFEFECDADRLVSVGMCARAVEVTGTPPAIILVRVYIDEIITGSFISETYDVAAGTYFNSINFNFLCPTKLSAGTHDVNVFLKSFTGQNVRLHGDPTGPIQIWTQDMGPYRSM